MVEAHGSERAMAMHHHSHTEGLGCLCQRDSSQRRACREESLLVRRRRRPRSADNRIWVNALLAGTTLALLLRREVGLPDRTERGGPLSCVFVSATDVGAVTDWGAGGVVIPLSTAGFQYTANVSIEEGNLNLHRNLVLDTTTNILGVRNCDDDFTALTPEQSSGTNPTEDDEVEGCLTWQDGETKLQMNWNCPWRDVDNGRVCFCPDDCDCEQQTSAWARNVRRQVTLSSAGQIAYVSSTTKIGLLPNISIWSESTLDGWAASDGVLGLATFPARECLIDPPVDENQRSAFGELLLELPDDARQLFALDLGDDDYDSTLEIGGYSGTTEAISWSESYPAKYPNAWIFSAFDVRACGVSLLQNITSSWPAVISTGSACLGLPTEMYNGLMEWLPVSNTTALSALPSLSFRLSEHGPPISISLSSLLIGESSEDTAETGDVRLCITKQHSMFGNGWAFRFPGDQPFVSLGTTALRSLYVVVDVDEGKVGLVQKDSSIEPSTGDESCEPAAVCIGSQAFEESTNSCSPLHCSLYFFYYLDEDTQTCKPPRGLRGLAWVVGISFAVIEFSGHFLRMYYGGTGVFLRGHQHRLGWEFYVGKIIEACMSKLIGAPGSNADDHRDD